MCDRLSSGLSHAYFSNTKKNIVHAQPLAITNFLDGN